jgi:hypothetical protein
MKLFVHGGKISCQMTEMLEISLRLFKKTQSSRFLFIAQSKMTSETSVVYFTAMSAAQTM